MPETDARQYDYTRFMNEELAADADKTGKEINKRRTFLS
jgi:hypothetical protein